MGQIEVTEYLHSTYSVGAEDSIILDLQQRLRQLHLKYWPEAAPDELLFLSAGPISDLSGQSMIAGPPNIRLVLRQPSEIEQEAELDALAGELELAAAAPLKVDIERWSNGWHLERSESVDTLAKVFEIATSLQPKVPTREPLNLSKDGELVENIGGSNVMDLVRPGCIAGLLGYDLSRWTNPARRAKPPKPEAVLGCLYIIDAWLIHNRRNGQLSLITDVNHPWANIDISNFLTSSEQKCTISAEGHYCAIESESDSSHADRVEQVIKAIEGGHLYQLNYGRNWSGPLADNPWLIMRRLANTNPAPFAGWMHTPDLGMAIVSASPESLLSVKSNRLATRPIKGTRPRGRDRASDVLLRHAMVASKKEVAEHMMLVDLSRNDIGRVCSPGTVRWSDWRVEALPQVQHMVSEVSGKLRDNVSIGEAVHALFPGGSITGCPKVATMAAISQLEDGPRGAWTGSLGILDERFGVASWNILIRTLEANRKDNFDDTVDSSLPNEEGGEWYGSIKAGGGIVIGSEALMEVEEARWKAAALLSATWSEGSDSALSVDLASAESAVQSAVMMEQDSPIKSIDRSNDVEQVGENFLNTKLTTAQPEHHPIPEIDERTSALLERLELERISARKDGQTTVATGSIIPFDSINLLSKPAQNRCLLVDNLDSFTWNIVHALLELGADVVVIPGRGPKAFESDLESVMTVLEKVNPTHIILGPGPSTPTSTPFTLSLAQLCLTGESRFPPLLGICLGHQALGVAAGWSLAPTYSGAVHGVPSKITHDGTGLFIDLPSVMTMMRYHSLSISEPAVSGTAAEGGIIGPLTEPSQKKDILENEVDGNDSAGLNGDLVVNGGGAEDTAVDLLGDLVVNGQHNDDDLVKLAGLIANGWSEDGVVMSIRHTTRPIHGIQFHPESCGSIQGNQIISQFLTETQTAE